MIRRPPRSTRTDTLFPYTTLFRSAHAGLWLSFSGRSTRFADTLRHLPAAAGRHRDVGTLAASLPAEREEPTCKRKTKAQIGRESCRDRVCQYVVISVVAVSLQNKQQTKKTRYATCEQMTIPTDNLTHNN